MRKSTLGLLAILVLSAGVLTHATTDVFAVVDKKSISSTEKNAEDAKAKSDEKTNKDNAKSSSGKNLSKMTKSSGFHNKKMSTIKAKRGLAAQKAGP